MVRGWGWGETEGVGSLREGRVLRRCSIDDAQSEWLTKEFARLLREYNTPELARELLQSYGMLDENGDLAERYRSTHCQ
jgi:hypothetical protein